MEMKEVNVIVTKFNKKEKHDDDVSIEIIE